MDQIRANHRGYVVKAVAENADSSTLAGQIALALNAGVTYEQMADDTRWPVEKLRAARAAHPEIQVVGHYEQKPR